MVGFRSERHQHILQNRQGIKIKIGLTVFAWLLMVWLPGMSWANDRVGDDFDEAYLLTNSGAYIHALKIYDGIIQQADYPHEQARALFLCGVIHHFYLNRPDEALYLFNKVLGNYPDSPSAEDALFHSGVIFIEQEKNEAARKTFLSYIEKYPQGIRKPSAELWYDSIIRRINEPVTFSDVCQANENIIRVLMADSETDLTFSSKMSISVYDMDAECYVYKGGKTATFRQDEERLLLNNQVLAGQRFRVTTEENVMALNNYECRGAYMVSVTSGGLQAVNYVSLEHYLYGIIPKEMPYTWDADALMAQAVASRTYALYLKKQNMRLPFDVTATASFQVYGGIGAEKDTTNHAVDATKGLVLTYHDRLIAAYFHANSAGHTEDAKKVWDVDMPYLKGIPDRYSKNLPYENWECYLSYEDITGCLLRAGHTLGNVFAINPKTISTNGRILTIQVMSDCGTAEMSGGHFRHSLDPMRIKSTKFQIVEKKNGVLLRGKGYGHGVGMSQWGANQMAKEGFHYIKILSHYYPGAVIAKVEI